MKVSPERAFKGFRFSDADIRHLRAFIAIVEFGGLSNTATESGISLTSLSRSLTTLEVRFGVKLCNRGRSGFAITPQGREIYTSAIALLENLNEFENSVFNIAHTSRGRLKLGIIDNILSTPGSRILNAIEQFSQQWPDIHLDLSVLTKPGIETAVRDGRIDVGITGDPLFFRTLNYIQLKSESHNLYASPRIVQKMGSDISHQPYVRRRFKTTMFEQVERQNNLRATATAGSLEALALLVAAGVGIGILPSHYVAANPHFALQHIPLPGTPLIAPFFAIHRVESLGVPVIDRFLTLLLKDAD